MKLFSWMQSTFSDARANSDPYTDQKSKEAPNDGLLAIGTLGCTNHTLVEQNLDTEIPQEEESSTPKFSEFTAKSLQKELTKLLRQKSRSRVVDLPLHTLLNCTSSLELDLDSDIDRMVRIILGRCKDVKKRAIGKKSLHFLLKKMFVCGSGIFASSRDIFQESRMEKLTRAMLATKIYPQNSHGASSPTQKCIEDYRHTQKWDMTSSEFIILEI